LSDALAGSAALAAGPDISSEVPGRLQTNKHRYLADEFQIPPEVGRFRRTKRRRVGESYT
jgi:hypothetical protein